MSVKLLVMDVDGTLTDGRIYIGADGEVMKAFDVKDGYAIVHLREYGIEPVIITGRSSAIVEKRAAELKITELHQGIGNKKEKLTEIAERYGITLEQIAYIGDDLNDLECMAACGLTACPADAAEEAAAIAKYVCRNSGGRGAVREFVSFILRSENRKLY